MVGGNAVREAGELSRVIDDMDDASSIQPCGRRSSSRFADLCAANDEMV